MEILTHVQPFVPHHHGGFVSCEDDDDDGSGNNNNNHNYNNNNFNSNFFGNALVQNGRFMLTE